MTVYTSPHYKPPAVIVLLCSLITTFTVVVIAVRQSLAINAIYANGVRLEAVAEQVRINTARLKRLEAK